MIMAREVATSFEGATLSETGKGSPIYKRLMRKVARTTALVRDKLTGENSHSSSDTINHSGSGRGCPLGVPIACQDIHRDINLAGSAKSPVATYIIAVPVFVPAGEQLYRLEVDILRLGPVVPFYAEVRDGSWGLSFGPAVGELNEDNGTTLSWNITLGAGLQYLTVHVTPGAKDVNSSRLLRWRLFPVRSGQSTGGNTVVGATTGNPGYVSSSIAPAAWREFYEEQFGDDAPLDGFNVAHGNGQLSALLEYLMGGPIFGNQTRTVTQEWRNNQAVFTSEPGVEFPLVCMALGAVERTGGPVVDSGYTDGMVDWYAPHINAGVTASGEKVCETRVMCPRCNGTGDMKAWVLASSNAGTPGSYTAEMRTTSTPGTFTQIGTSAFYVAEITNIPFTAGSMFLADVFIDGSGAAVFGDLNVLGVCVAFDP